jgi:hypothetical protein
MTWLQKDEPKVEYTKIGRDQTKSLIDGPISQPLQSNTDLISHKKNKKRRRTTISINKSRKRRHTPRILFSPTAQRTLHIRRRKATKKRGKETSKYHQYTTDSHQQQYRRNQEKDNQKTEQKQNTDV